MLSKNLWQRLLWGIHSWFAQEKLCRNFLLLQVLGMAVPSLLATSVCKICNMGLEAEAFELSYPLLKQLHKYDITNWKEELNIGWKRYDDCAINNETYFFKQLKYLQDMTRFYVARHPLLLQSRMHEQEYYNSFSHLLFVDEETSEFDYLKHVQNPKALKLTHAADIDHIISICKVLNPKQERGNMLIIIKLSPPLLHDLDAYIGKMKEEGIVVTWLLDPLVTVPKGHEVITWSLGKSLEKLRPICNILGRSGYNLGGFYMETTGDESECKLYHETIMKNQSRLDVELSLAALEELGLARFTIYRTGGGWLRMN
ncbi:uncharacterized protein LOC111283579 [Durio zibethinus]|uniref:Phospho-2-dehydro-3-deoxyheptonate aldolase n=1 Tax=Durio zibethinus TaxID=66656 RepID=A0A6P5XHY5_DURZI|nr:uncharacterized protein LOC111283579 [Durio zibethinus]